MMNELIWNAAAVILGGKMYIGIELWVNHANRTIKWLCSNACVWYFDCLFVYFIYLYTNMCTFRKVSEYDNKQSVRYMRVFYRNALICIVMLIIIIIIGEMLQRHIHTSIAWMNDSLSFSLSLLQIGLISIYCESSQSKSPMRRKIPNWNMELSEGGRFGMNLHSVLCI